MDVVGKLPEFLRRAASLFEVMPDLRQGAAILRQLAVTADQPFNLAVVGRMKTGKSTLINSLVERELAVVDVEEATATINWFCHGIGPQTDQFIVHWKDGRTESYPVDRLKTDWTGKSAEVMARAGKASRLQLFSDAPKLREVQIIDTPGTGSAVEAHEAGAREFLNPDVFKQSASEGNKADAIIYVVRPVGRESDVENLELFRSARLTNSGPYNSVCVLHHWDSLEGKDPATDAAQKAARLSEQLADMVSTVIPVSGPIALAAKAAPDAFFDRLLNVTSNLGAADLESVLKVERRWKQDDERAGILSLFDLPWSSFTLIVRQLREVQNGDIATARKRCLDYSRIADLEKFVEDRFFSQAAIIRRCQLLEKTEQVYVPSIRGVEAEAKRLDEDSKCAEQAAKALKPKGAELAQWMANKQIDWQFRYKRFYAALLSLDQAWEQHRAELEGLHLDLKVSETMTKVPDLFRAEDQQRIRSLCDHLATPERRSQMGQSRLTTLPELQRLIDCYRARANRSSRANQRLLEHVVRRLEEAYQLIERI